VYPRYFGLREPSFAITPDPQYLYLSRQHREALAHLLYGAGQGGGFVLLTGEVGTGKTTVCRAFLEQVPDDVDVALVLNPAMTAVELMHAICREFGVDVPDEEPSVKVLVDRLNDYLLEAHARGRHPVLIIDEAQNLRPKVLEQIRLLTNLETTKHKLLQIFLIGQPELRTLLSSVDLRQLNQRVTARFHLQPLGAAETAAYVEHRISIAGVDRPLFTPRALRRVHRCSGGVPRLINLICDRALLGTAANRQLQVTPAIVKRAAQEVRGTGQPVAAGFNRAITAVLALVLAVGTGVWLGTSGLAHESFAALRALAGAPSPVQQAPTELATTPPPVADTPTEISSDQLIPTISAALIADEPRDEGTEYPNGQADETAPTAPTPAAEPINRTVQVSTPASVPTTAPPPASDPETIAPAALETTRTVEAESAGEPSAEQATTTAQPTDEAKTKPPGRLPAPRLSVSAVHHDLPDSAAADLSSLLRDEPDAITALTSSWGISPPSGASISCQSIRGFGLECQRDEGRWSDLRRFDRPVALRLSPASGKNDGYVVISALDEEFATIEGADGPTRVPIATVDERWSGDYLLLWRPPRPGVRFISRKSWGEVVQWLRGRLAELPATELTDIDSPVYDQKMVQAVQRFQRSQGLISDGIAGPRTLILLDNLVAESGQDRVSQSP
jgi:general secretion pathway protein A